MLLDVQPLHVSLARNEDDIRAAQRLRYDVFVSELGGDGPGVDHNLKLETDRFDAFADHILLKDARHVDGPNSGVVGVYRMMTREHADAAGSFYSESEFDLSLLKSSSRRLLELGRSCLHPHVRSSGGLMALWQGVADYVHQHRIDTLFGVASFHGTDLARLQNALSHLQHTHLAPREIRVASRTPQVLDLLPPSQIDRKAAMRDTPALIKSYLKLGGGLGQGVFVDHAFNTTDVCLLLNTAGLTSETFGRHTRHTQ